MVKRSEAWKLVKRIERKIGELLEEKEKVRKRRERLTKKYREIKEKYRSEGRNVFNTRPKHKPVVSKLDRAINRNQELRKKIRELRSLTPRYDFNLHEKIKPLKENKDVLRKKYGINIPKGFEEQGKKEKRPEAEFINAMMRGVGKREIEEKVGSIEKLRQLINKPKFRKAAVSRAKKAYSEQEPYANISQMKGVTAIKKKPRIAFYALLDKYQESKEKRPESMKKMDPSPTEPTEKQKEKMGEIKKKGKKKKLKKKVKGMLKEEVKKEIKKELKRKVKRQASEEIEKGS